jgi:hypothetical protein
MRRRVLLLATAASFALVTMVSMNTWLAPIPVPQQVAAVEKAMGTIFVLGEKAEMLEVAGLSSVVTGQTVRTDRDAAMGLAWLRGGSLRLDERTEITFLADDRIDLASGRIYFDSDGIGDALTISTRYGDIQHLGTQYMALAGDKDLTVSVREGRVAVTTGRGDQIAAAGQQMTLKNDRRAPERLSIKTYGPDWVWVETAASPPPLAGKTIYDLLLWVSRETGYRFDFADAATERVVRTESAEGDLSETPRIALRQSLRTVNLHSNIDDPDIQKSGVILIRQ